MATVEEVEAPPAPAPAPADGRRLDLAAVRAQFPALELDIRGKRLAYLDNAATTQKPKAVLKATEVYYTTQNANVHRGVHLLAERATVAYEGARERVARFLGASAAEEIVFVRGCTEAVNLVASSFGRARLNGGDEILVTEMEHHSNIVPWQMVCQATGARLVVAPMDDDGVLDLEAFKRRLSPRTRMVAVAHVSNALGTINPVAELTEWAHDAGAAILVDGAQAAPHLRIDVNSIGCDFYAISGHKAYGPTGIGALYARRPWLDELPPYQGGGEMIRRVTFEATEYNTPPHKFEAGTPNIAGAVGFGAALDYLDGVGWEAIARHEAELVAYASATLSDEPGVRLIGTSPAKAGVVSFTLEGVHPHDLATILDLEGIAIRAGHHCAQPVMDHFGLPATARASFAMYNTGQEVERLVAGIRLAREWLS